MLRQELNERTKGVLHWPQHLQKPHTLGRKPLLKPYLPNQRSAGSLDKVQILSANQGVLNFQTIGDSHIAWLWVDSTKPHLSSITSKQDSSPALMKEARNLILILIETYTQWVKSTFQVNPMESQCRLKVSGDAHGPKAGQDLAQGLSSEGFQSRSEMLQTTSQLTWVCLQCSHKPHEDGRPPVRIQSS